MLHSVDINDYMQKNPVKVAQDDNIFTAIELITQHKISGLCVVDTNDKLVGVLSEMDCLKAVLSATYNQSGSTGKVADFMTADVQACELHDDVVDVANDMLRKGHRRRPVVSGDKLIGQITCRRLLTAVKVFNDTK